MKLSGKSAGLALLGIAYLLSAVLAFRHFARNDKPERVTIRIAHWQLEAGVREAIDAVIRRYEQVNPRVHVVQIAVPDGPTYVSWVLTQMEGGSAPDLIEYSVANPNVARIFQPIGADVMEPNPYNRGTPLEGVKWRDTFVDELNSLDSFIQALHDYYSVSLDTYLGRVLYNKPLMKSITGTDQPPRTYREMLAVCDRIRSYAKSRGLKLVPLANSRDTNQNECMSIANCMTGEMAKRLDFEHKLSVFGDELGRGYLRGDWSFDSPEVVATFRELREYGAMCAPGFWTRERDTAVTDFVTGHAVMIEAPSWEATNLLALSKFEIAAFRFPYPREDDPVYGKFAKGPFFECFQTGTPIYLNRSTRHRAEAVDFLRFLTSWEGNTLFAQVSNWPPSIVGVEPSKFAAQFKPETGGYAWSCNIFIPAFALDATGFITSHMSELWSTSGSVEGFLKIMREGLGEKIRDDLRHEIHSGLDELRRGDAVAVARVAPVAPGRRPDVLPVTATLNEGDIYQSRVVLAGPVQVPPSTVKIDPGWTAGPHPGEARATLGSEAGTEDPDLASGWNELADGHAGKAVEVFDRKLAATDPMVARQARFGRGVSLLDLQPVTESQLREATRIFTALAESGTDDPAQGALFFLGRIPQHHQAVPDGALAIRNYRRLVTAYPESIWAQTALTRLALLELYAPDGAAGSDQRVARAEKLLALAHTPDSESDLHLAVAYAIFFYRLPPTRALPHLLAVERLGRVTGTIRYHALLQIAELSRLGGEKAQAEHYFRQFLVKFPAAGEVGAVRERLADLEKP